MLALFFFLFLIIITLFIQSFVVPMPIGDLENTRYRTLPVMTLLLILINSIIFVLFQAANLYQGSQLLDEGNLGPASVMLNEYIRQIWTFGYRGIFMRDGIGIGAFATFSSMFMHADMWHLIGNMIYLWAFGRRVEDACGPWRYLLFYLGAGMIASIGSEVFNFNRVDIPSIGASGAIAGVMGAYLVLFPGSLLTSFWGIGIILRVPVVLLLKLFGVRAVAEAPVWRWTIRLPSFILLIFFLASELISQALQFLDTTADLGGVNHVAHIAGFLAALIIFLYVRKDLLMRYFTGRRL